MRTLLRNSITKKYFAFHRTWTDNPAEALDFHFIARAEDYAGTWRLKAVEVAFAFEPAEEWKELPARTKQPQLACAEV